RTRRGCDEGGFGEAHLRRDSLHHRRIRQHLPNPHASRVADLRRARERTQPVQRSDRRRSALLVLPFPESSTAPVSCPAAVAHHSYFCSISSRPKRVVARSSVSTKPLRT